MNPDIHTRLLGLESELGISILFACDNGSRSWGAHTETSDHDIKVIYRHPREWYEAVNIASKKDVIERKFPDLNAEISGWDLFKTLNLVKKNNPTLYEMFSSPVVYVSTPGAALIQEYLRAHPNYKTLYIGYYAIAKFYQQQYTKLHTIKEALGCIRGILLAEWYSQYPTLKGHPIPHSFEELLQTIRGTNSGLIEEIEALLRLRRQGGRELPGLPPATEGFIVSRLESFDPEKTQIQTDLLPNYDGINEIYRTIIHS